MSSSIYRFTLDMQSNQSQVSLPVRLNDTNRELNIILTNGGTPFIMETGYRAVLSAKKFDGNELINNCEIKDNSVICYTFTAQTTTVAGVVDCELRVYDAQGKNITSPRFILVVDERVVYDEEILPSRYEGTALDYILGSESARQFSETDRLIAEGLRERAENDRVTAESNRALAESERKGAENIRIEAEESRTKAETARAKAEETRANSESERVSAEEARVEAEKSRAETHKEMSQTLSTIGSLATKEELGEVESIAKQANIAKSYVSYSNMQSNLQYMSEDDLNIGQSIYIGTKHVPDVWVYLKRSDKLMYTHTDEEILDAFSKGNYIQVGYFVLAPLETLKVNLEDYASQDYVDVALNSVNDRISNAEQALTDGLREVSIADSQYTDWKVSEEVQQAVSDMEHYTDEKATEIKTAIAETSNAIKGKATGEVVRVNDVSPIEHTVKCKVKSDDASIDLASVKVTRCGKNLFDLSGLEFNDTDYTHSFTNTDTTATALYDFMKHNTGKTIMLSAKISGTASGVEIGTIRFYNANATALSIIVPNQAHTIADLPDEFAYLTIYGSNTGASVTDIQIEYGDTITDYEAYKEAETYTPTSDGTVEGIKSVAPTMTLLTDTANVVVEIEYNQDINVLNKRLAEALDAILVIQKTLIGGTSQ